MRINVVGIQQLRSENVSTNYLYVTSEMMKKCSRPRIGTQESYSSENEQTCSTLYFGQTQFSGVIGELFLALRERIANDLHNSMIISIAKKMNCRGRTQNKLRLFLHLKPPAFNNSVTERDWLVAVARYLTIS